MHGKEPLPTLDASEVQEVRKELVAIRDKVNTLLDAIDATPKSTSSKDVGVVQMQSSAKTSVDTTTKTEGMSKSTTNFFRSLGLFEPILGVGWVVLFLLRTSEVGFWLSFEGNNHLSSACRLLK